MNDWPKVRLGEIILAVERAEAPICGKTYRQIGVKLWGEGAYERETLDGGSTKYAKLFRVEADDIIVNKIWARNGSVAVVPEALTGCYGSAEFPMFEPKRDQLSPRWIHWITKTRRFWKQCDEKSQGTSGKNRIRPERFLDIEIPLPPLAEQRRIVERVEELAAQIREACVLREKAAKEKESFIAASISTFCFNGSEIGRFEEYLIEAKNGMYKPPYAWGHGTPCLRMYNIEGPTLNLCNLQLLDVSTEELEAYGCIEGDLIFNRVNSADLVGKTGLVPAEFPQTTFESKNMRLRVNRAKVIPEFAARVLNSAPTRKYYRNVLKQQCGMATLNQGHVRNIPFPRFSLTEQRIRIAKMVAMQTEVDRLKHLQVETAAELDALLPAILDRAFKGEL